MTSKSIKKLAEYRVQMDAEFGTKTTLEMARDYEERKLNKLHSNLDGAARR